mgnify:CR=1 FL=1
MSAPDDHTPPVLFVPPAMRGRSPCALNQARSRCPTAESSPGISSGATGYVDYDWDWHGEVPSVALAPNFDPNNWDAYTGAARVTSSATENDHKIKAGRFFQMMKRPELQRELYIK